MARKHIKVQFVQGASPSSNQQRFTTDECLEMAVRAESLDHQGLIEERHLQHSLTLEVGA